MTSLSFPTPPKRLLIIKPSAIGDVVHTLPILAIMRKRFPESHIAWLLTPLCAQLLDGHPMLNEVILFERRKLGRGWRDPESALGLISFAKMLKAREFDLVIDLQGLLRSGLMTWLTRSPARVGFANARELAPLFYTHRVPIESVEQHAIDRYLKVAAAIGCETSLVEFPFHITDTDRADVRTMLGGIERYAVVIPGTNWPTKRWPVEKFAALVEPLKQRFGLATIATGSKEETDLCEAIGATTLAGRTNLRQLAALIEGSELVIANDSGPMHIAAAMGKPLVTPFGPTNPLRTGPYQRMDSVIRVDIPCSPCYSRKCSHQSCLKWLESEAVLELARSQLDRVARTT